MIITEALKNRYRKYAVRVLVEFSIKDDSGKHINCGQQALYFHYKSHIKRYFDSNNLVGFKKADWVKKTIKEIGKVDISNRLEDFQINYYKSSLGKFEYMMLDKLKSASEVFL